MPDGIFAEMHGFHDRKCSEGFVVVDDDSLIICMYMEGSEYIGVYVGARCVCISERYNRFPHSL
jgi:hypothetical protein